MRIEKLSIKAVTISIFLMVGVVAIVLSLFAGTYFRQAALNEQISSLSRVIEVAAQELLRDVSQHTFGLGMVLGHNRQLIKALKGADARSGQAGIVALLDDPFVNGFVGFSEVNLVKLRVYSLDLELVAESSVGMRMAEDHMPGHLATQVIQRNKTGRLQAIDALWMSETGPLFSTLVPLGGLHAAGYLEVVVDPVFNLRQIGNITRTPISVLASSEQQIEPDQKLIQNRHLPVTYTLSTSDGRPAFRIVGYEDVSKLDDAMRQTQVVTTSGFLLLTLGTLLFALWLFSRFLFEPLGQMIRNMGQIAHGKLDLVVNKKGLREFSRVADSFELMIDQVKLRASELERLLDLDDSAILRFGRDGEAIYFNRVAMEVFGYQEDEIPDLDLGDLFSEAALGLMASGVAAETALPDAPLSLQLDCRHKSGAWFTCDAVINPSVARSGSGYTIVLSPVSAAEDVELSPYVASRFENNELRMRAVEESLNSILEVASSNRGAIPGLDAMDGPVAPGAETEDDKLRLRESVVRVMQSALACWESDLEKSKLDLAEESGIWHVYIDKSTPTTRTLDKYLHIDSCPMNPRSQRVSDTAEFVLRETRSKPGQHRQRLQEELEAFRQLRSGI
jgi:PAS domain-containing protein